MWPKRCLKFNPNLAICSVKNILQHLDLLSIKFFTFAKDDVKNKEEVSNRLLEVRITGKCCEVLVDPASNKIIMKDASHQIAKTCQFSIQKNIKKEKQ